MAKTLPPDRPDRPSKPSSNFSVERIEWRPPGSVAPKVGDDGGRWHLKEYGVSTFAGEMSLDTGGAQTLRRIAIADTVQCSVDWACIAAQVREVRCRIRGKFSSHRAFELNPRCCADLRGPGTLIRLWAISDIVQRPHDFGPSTDMAERRDDN